MAWANIAQGKKPNFYVAKSWHHTFCGNKGSHITHAQKEFSVKITLPPRESNETGIIVDGDNTNISKARQYFEQICGFTIGSDPLLTEKYHITHEQIINIQKDLTQSNTLQFIRSKGVAIKFPLKNNNNHELTIIQGRLNDIHTVMDYFSGICGLKNNDKFQPWNEKKHQVQDGNKDEIEEKGIIKNSSENNYIKFNVINFDCNNNNNNNKKRNHNEIAEALFFHPKEDDEYDFNRFLEYLSSANKSIDICVFTITDNRIRNVLNQEYKNGTRIRIITDNSQAESLGSDALWLKEQGIPVKVDNDPQGLSHMHHKFAVVDADEICSTSLIMTGSFNWTRSASDNNYENILITNQVNLIQYYKKYFDHLWFEDKSLIDINEYKKKFGKGILKQ